MAFSPSDISARGFGGSGGITGSKRSLHPDESTNDLKVEKFCDDCWGEEC